MLAVSYFLLRRDSVGTTWLALLVLSHWALDFASHRPDMPLWPGSTLFGLGLWYSLPATLVVEFRMFASGAWLYARVTAPRDRTGRYALWGFIATLAAVYAGSVFGPPPPSVNALAISGLLDWLFVA